MSISRLHKYLCDYKVPVELEETLEWKCLSNYIFLESDLNLKRIRKNKKDANVYNNFFIRVANKLMKFHYNSGKKELALRILCNTLDIIAKKTSQNPIDVFLKAFTNAIIWENVRNLKFGGHRISKLVYVSPKKIITNTLSNLVLLSVKGKVKDKIENLLSIEIIYASKNDGNSIALSKKKQVANIVESANA